MSIGVLLLAIGCSSALAQQPGPPPSSIVLLARIGCETGAAMLGLSADAFSFRVINNGPHALMIPAKQCDDFRLRENKPFVFVLSHTFQNQNRIRESYYYLMNQRGDLLNAVHFQDGRSHPFAYASPDMPIRRADFAAEKEVWISRVAELERSLGQKSGAK